MDCLYCCMFFWFIHINFFGIATDERSRYQIGRGIMGAVGFDVFMSFGDKGGSWRVG